MKRGFNNRPKQEDEESEAPISTWYIDPEAWEEVRSEQASRMLLPRASGYLASQHDGYVLSFNYAYEVALRQRGLV